MTFIPTKQQILCSSTLKIYFHFPIMFLLPTLIYTHIPVPCGPCTRHSKDFHLNNPKLLLAHMDRTRGTHSLITLNYAYQFFPSNHSWKNISSQNIINDPSYYTLNNLLKPSNFGHPAIHIPLPFLSNLLRARQALALAHAHTIP